MVLYPCLYRFPTLWRIFILCVCEILLVHVLTVAPGGCPFFFSWRFFLSDGLRNYFSQFGKVDACTIMRDPAGRSRGFAFLTFEDPAAVNAVMVREHYLDGKIVGSFFFFFYSPSRLRSFDSSLIILFYFSFL